MHTARASRAVVVVICVVLLVNGISAARQSRDITGLISRADAGDSGAEEQLLRFLVHQDVTVPGFNAALLWLRSRVAERDEPHAEVVLGYLYEHGRGVTRDYAKAAANYQAAALHEDHLAENNLAFLYQRGLGVP